MRPQIGFLSRMRLASYINYSQFVPFRRKYDWLFLYRNMIGQKSDRKFHVKSRCRWISFVKDFSMAAIEAAQGAADVVKSLIPIQTIVEETLFLKVLFDSRVDQPAPNDQHLELILGKLSVNDV